MNKLVFILWLLSLSFPSLSDVISASDKGFQYTGRIDFTDKNKPYLTWPGTSIKANITGNKLILLANDDTGNNYFNVIINGQDTHPYVLRVAKGSKQYDLSHLITSDKTEIEIFKRTEGLEGGTYFEGFEISGKQLEQPPVRPTRKIAFFGDSITTGVGNERADNDIDEGAAQKNHYLAYPAIAARNLNAEFHTIAKGGIGFMVSWFNFIMPEYYDQITAESNNDSKWDFSVWQPDVVVVNLGQNDSWLIDRKRLQPTPSENDIIDAYADFILTLSALYPNAKFISVLGSMDITKNNKWTNYIERAIKVIKQKNNKIEINMTLFEFNGYKKHPRVQQHVTNAAKLSRHIKTLMNW